LTIGNTARTIDPSWNALRPKSRLCLVRMCEAACNPVAVLQVGMPSGSKFTVPNLLPGHTYWFKVCAGNQQGPWSDPATGVAG